MSINEIGSTNWISYDGCWHQKIYVNHAGERIYTYYHQSRFSNPALAIEIDTHFARKYCAYKLIEKDLQDILEFIDTILGLISMRGKKADMIIKGLTRAIVVTYGKCFTKADGRKTKVDESIIPDNLKDAHVKIMGMRNNYVAHAGTSMHEKCIGVLTVPPGKKVKKTDKNIPKCFFTEAYQTMTSEIVISKKTRLLIVSIQKNIKKKLEKSGNKLHEACNNLDFDKIYKMAKKNKTNRIKLNEVNFKKMQLS